MAVEHIQQVNLWKGLSTIVAFNHATIIIIMFKHNTVCVQVDSTSTTAQNVSYLYQFA